MGTPSRPQSPGGFPPGDSAKPHSDTTPRDPALVLVLNLFGCAGAGYYLLGQRGKALIAILVFFAVGIPTFFAAGFAVSAITAIDVFMQARQVRKSRRIGPWTILDRST